LFASLQTNPGIPLVREFVEFALGKQGRDVVNTVGFVGQQSQVVARPPLPSGVLSLYPMEVRDADRVNFQLSEDLEKLTVEDGKTTPFPKDPGPAEHLHFKAAEGYWHRLLYDYYCSSPPVVHRAVSTAMCMNNARSKRGA
jgi:hypothetical protein